MEHPPDVSDAELARQARAGSMAAFEDLVSRYEQRIYRFVLAICRNPDDACEVTQDTFVRGFQALSRFDATQPFGAWLFTIARRKCIDHLRARPPAMSNQIPDIAIFDDPADGLCARETRRSLWELAQALLPSNQLQALWLRYAEDMEVARIAKVMGLTKTHVKVLLFRARQTLGNHLIASPNPELQPWQTSIKDESESLWAPLKWLNLRKTGKT